MNMRKEFHNELKNIHTQVLFMGDMVSKSILKAVNALTERNLENAQQVIDDDRIVDQRRYEIELGCINLIATQQPMAVDLRTIMGVTSIITELERIGDYAEGIARIVIMIGDEPPLKQHTVIPLMAEKTVAMLNATLEAYTRSDADMAREIVARDDEVDNLCHDLYRLMIGYMLEDPKTITRATRIIWVAHNLERAADRTTNICEKIVFTVTGKLEEIGASKY